MGITDVGQQVCPTPAGSLGTPLLGRFDALPVKVT